MTTTENPKPPSDEMSLEEIMRSAVAFLPPPRTEDELAAEAAERARRDAQRAAHEREEAWARLVPPRYVDALPTNLAALEERVRVLTQGRVAPVRVVLGWLSGHRGGVVFRGGAGGGKTTLAVAALRERFEQDPAGVVWMPARTLGLARIQHAAGQDEPPAVQRAISARLLVLDDLGNERQTANNACPDVIFERHDQGRPTWVTTGMTREELEKLYGAGVARRIYERAKIVTCEREASSKAGAA